jgi:hypothetical protein
MSASKLLTFGFWVFLLCALAAPRCRADEWNKATKVSFSAPIEIPGRVLAAGTYWFTLANLDSNRHIVQIWNADRTQLITTILAIPDYRLQPTGKTVMTFEERRSDTPEALQAWFYPGDNFGQEFVYPRVRATELAKRVGRPVLSMAPNKPSEAEMKQTPVQAVSPSGETTEIAQATPPQPTAPAKQLPKTASLLPLWGLLGLISLGAGLALGRLVKNMA